MKLNLTQVSEGLKSSLTPLCQQQIIHHGQVQSVYHQGDKRNRLQTLTEPIQIVGIESKADTQLAWLAESMQPVTKAKTYGTGGRDQYTATLTLLVLSRKSETLQALLTALAGPYDVQVTNVDLNTLRVIREGWLMEVGQEKNYDPSLYAWAVRCQFAQVQLMSVC
ncbi:hypothetical protein [Telluribacter humicola]|uniref:hypothetical protein n=1 Tax=Telluribacter humicola TaxID=1720261 RepID=UPI001A9778AD|nr:hypothetical protein [Telluribacter humicola]